MKIFKIFENLLGEFGLELGHLGFIIRNYYIRVSIMGVVVNAVR